MRFKSCFILTLAFLMILLPVTLADSVNREQNSASIANADNLAFISSKDGKKSINVMPDLDAESTKITTNDNISNLLWSPDASRILYISTSGSFFNSQNEIWVVNSDGTGQLKVAGDCELIFNPTSYDVCWAPDASKILFCAKRDGKKHIFVINSDGSNEQCLTEDNLEGTYASWSPDGSKIVCLLKNKGDREIYLMNSDGTEKIRLTKNSGDYMRPTWSPDGKKIAFVYRKPLFAIFGRKSGIYVMNADGSGLSWLAKGDDVFWAPDSSAIAFTLRIVDKGSTTTSYAPNGTFTHTTSSTTTYSTYLINVDKKSRAKLLGIIGREISYPGWSHDATKIAYISNYSLNMRISGQSDSVSLDVPFATGTPVWSADDTKIACLGRANILSKLNIYIATADGEKIYKMEGEENFSDPAWAPVK